MCEKQNLKMFLVSIYANMFNDIALYVVFQS